MFQTAAGEGNDESSQLHNASTSLAPLNIRFQTFCASSRLFLPRGCATLAAPGGVRRAAMRSAPLLTATNLRLVLPVAFRSVPVQLVLGPVTLSPN